jgi:hypothetical protein
MRHQPSEPGATRRARNTVVSVFAALGGVVPIAFYRFVSYIGPAPRSYNYWDHLLWSVIPYVWPSSFVLLPATEGDIRDSIGFCTMSLALNVLIYAVVGWGLWQLGRLIAKFSAKRRPS